MLREPYLAQKYFQQIRPPGECTESDGTCLAARCATRQWHAPRAVACHVVRPVSC